MTTNFKDFASNLTGSISTEGGLSVIQDNAKSLEKRLTIRFSVWRGEWPFNLDFGFDYRSILGGKLPKPVIDSMIRQEVREEPDVLRIEAFKSEMSRGVRFYSCSCTVVTTEGEYTLKLGNVTPVQFDYPVPEGNTDLCFGVTVS